MADREMLELAAKAAGIGPILCYEAKRNLLRIGDRKAYRLWRPLTNDGDALRLAVRLNINVFIYDDETSTAQGGVVAKNWGSKEANTRRAIVRTAAEMGPAAASLEPKP